MIDFRLNKAPACACFTSHGRRRHRSIEHVAGVDDFEVAEATYWAAVARWPRGAHHAAPRRAGGDEKLDGRVMGPEAALTGVSGT
jgi:hypothetical protein